MERLRPVDVKTCVLVDDHPALRDGLKLRLGLESDLQIVGEAANAAEAREVIAATSPDVAIVDVRLPDEDGISLVRSILSEGSRCRFIIFSANADRNVVERALKAGARGYLGKDSPAEMLIRAIQVVHAGKQFIDPTIAGAMLGSDEESLTERETQILTAMGRGLPNKTIAAELGVTEETIKTHVAHIIHKMDSGNRTGAVAEAIRRSIIE